MRHSVFFGCLPKYFLIVLLFQQTKIYNYFNVTSVKCKFYRYKYSSISFCWRLVWMHGLCSNLVYSSFEVKSFEFPHHSILVCPNDLRWCFCLLLTVKYVKDDMMCFGWLYRHLTMIPSFQMSSCTVAILGPFPDTDSMKTKSVAFQVYIFPQ